MRNEQSHPQKQSYRVRTQYRGCTGVIYSAEFQAEKTVRELLNHFPGTRENSGLWQQRLPKGQGCKPIKMTWRQLTHAVLSYRPMTCSGWKGKTTPDVSHLCPLSREAPCLTLVLQHDSNNFRFCDDELVPSSLWLAHLDRRESIQSS